MVWADPRAREKRNPGTVPSSTFEKPPCKMEPRDGSGVPFCETAGLKWNEEPSRGSAFLPIRPSLVIAYRNMHNKTDLKKLFPTP